MPPRRTLQSGRGVRLVHGRPQLYTRAAWRQEAGRTCALIASKLPEGFKPFAGPLAVAVRFVEPYRSGERKSVVKSRVEIPNDKRPDIDNRLKIILDSCTAAGLWLDDSQIASLRASKYRGPAPYWRVAVRPLSDGPSAAEDSHDRTGTLPGLEGGAK